MRWIKGLFNKDDSKIVPTDTGEQEVTLSDSDNEEGQLSLDVYQDKDNVIVKSTIAGVRPEDLDITISNDTVTIKGERKREQTVRDEDYFYQECYWGAFSRSLNLPVEVDVDHATADLKDGILTVILPKASRLRTKKVKVKETSE